MANIGEILQVITFWERFCKL